MGILGPMMGFMLGSFCAKVYVDIGSVDLGELPVPLPVLEVQRSDDWTILGTTWIDRPVTPDAFVCP